MPQTFKSTNLNPNYKIKVKSYLNFILLIYKNLILIKIIKIFIFS